MRSVAVRDLGQLAYDEALALQTRAVAARVADETPDVLFLVEHEPVYTLGRNADPRHITADRAALAQRGIAVKQTSRGGQVTYHGPGQLVGYPILSLRDWGHDVAAYVGALETVLMRTLAAFGVTGTTDAANRGVWVGPNKIAAIGVRVTRQVTMHGFALNVAVRLADYDGIVPCGIAGRGVASLDRFVPGVTVESVKPALIGQFREVFGYDATA
jgi:lipoyl(octanoyl) transferase